jgi:hypothetical protein
MMMERIEPYLPQGKEMVFVTEVGSGMWGMREISSDYDLVVVYAERSSDILAGRRYEPNLPSQHHVMLDDLEHDFQFMEIGHLIMLLKRGNINAIWATLSPIVVHSSKMHQMIVEYVNAYPTKAIMPSLEGMVKSQLSDSVKRAAARSPEKSILTAMRTVRFGQHLLTNQRYGFLPVTGEWSIEDVEKSLCELKIRMVQTEKLVEAIPDDGLEKILLHYRIEQLASEQVKYPHD